MNIEQAKGPDILPDCTLKICLDFADIWHLHWPRAATNLQAARVYGNARCLEVKSVLCKVACKGRTIPAMKRPNSLNEFTCIAVVLEGHVHGFYRRTGFRQLGKA